jgi:hypothetical protein
VLVHALPPRQQSAHSHALWLCRSPPLGPLLTVVRQSPVSGT